jgi:uncharacterized membrane protein YphA (DoxX/SURF4 family)
MLSAFPYLLSWGELAPLIIRATLGSIFIYWAYRAFRKGPATLQTKIVAVAECIAGILLVIGLWTQVAALFAAIDLVMRLVERIRSKAFLTDGVNYYLVLLVLALSLLVTGAGFMAFDLPL